MHLASNFVVIVTFVSSVAGWAAVADAQPPNCSISSPSGAATLRSHISARLDGALTRRGCEEVDDAAQRRSWRPLDGKIARVDQVGPKRHDSVLNGVLIGAAAGAALGLIPDYLDDCEECHDSLYASIAVGAGIGLLVDALRTSQRPVHPLVSRVPVHVGVARRGVGIRAMIRWR